MSCSSSRASSPRHSTPHVPSFRPEELLDKREEETIRRKLFPFEEPPPTVRHSDWRASISSGRGEEDGKAQEATHVLVQQELQLVRQQLEEERNISRNLVAERTNLRSQVCKAQSDLQALGQKHQHTLLGLEQMCIQLGESKQKEEQAKCMEASLRTLQAIASKMGAATKNDALEALRSGLSSVLSEYKPSEKASWTPPRGKRRPSGVSGMQATEKPSESTPLEARSFQLTKPHWDGQYLSSPPKALMEGGSTPSARLSLASCEAAGDFLPPPPSSKCWEWPMSKPETKERVAMIDAQLWRYEQTGLIEQVEMLQDLCAQHGIAPQFEDEIVSTASSESV